MRYSDIYFYLWLTVLHWNLSDSYRNIRLQDYLCADNLLLALQNQFRGSPALTLTEDRESAAIVTQVWNVSLPGHHSSTNKLKYDCRFRVQTPERQPRGIYVIITSLKLRQNLDGQCIDYIEFYAGKSRTGQRFCNDITMDGPGGQVILDRDTDRDLYVHVHIESNRMISEPLELRMVLTAHSECRFTGDFLCDPSDRYSCISRHFVGDNITNCMSPCRDEVYCYHDAVATGKINTTNVAISAITSLIFTMLGVGFCVWICWKYWNCITVQQHAHEASAAAHRQDQRVETHTIDLPSAPQFDENVSSSNTDVQPPTPKDMPPSYESLFPES